MEDLFRAGGQAATRFAYSEAIVQLSSALELLKQLPDDKVVVLGLVSSKFDELESVEQLIGRIEEAARFYPRDQLALSTQCGFASASETAEQRLMTQDVQAAKLKLVADVAHDVWG